ncbi:cold-shock protein [Caballeronia arvi]
MSGFITPDGGDEDLLKEGQKVTFDEKMGPKGKQAANIKPA